MVVAWTSNFLYAIANVGIGTAESYPYVAEVGYCV